VRLVITNHPGRWLQQCSPRRAAAKTCDACGFCCSLETWCCLSSVAIAETKQFGVSERPSVRCSTQDEPATLLSPLRIVLVNLSLLSHRGLLFARHRQSALPLQAALFVGTLALPTGDTGRWSRRAK
jgi:hypothetical protein